MTNVAVGLSRESGYHLGMETGKSELRIIDEKGERTLRMGEWDEHIARIHLPSTPNGTYAVVLATRRRVFSKAGNFGDGKRNGIVVVIEDTTV